MKTLTIDKNKCESYKTFYETVYKELEGKKYIDWEEYENLLYSADMLDEFLWYVHVNDDTEFVMVNFDVKKIKEQKTLDDYKWNIIFEVLIDFVNKYPSNKLTIVGCES